MGIEKEITAVGKMEYVPPILALIVLALMLNKDCTES